MHAPTAPAGGSDTHPEGAALKSCGVQLHTGNQARRGLEPQPAVNEWVEGDPQTQADILREPRTAPLPRHLLKKRHKDL